MTSTDHTFDSIRPMGEQSDATTHYVDGEKLAIEMGKWKDEYNRCKKEELDTPIPNDYIGHCIIQIADNVGNLHNFRRYSYLDEMKLAAIENIVRYLYNYKPEAETKGGKPNPFAYFTRNIMRSFITHINTENRQKYYKLKTFQKNGGALAFDDESPEDANSALSAMENFGANHADWDDWIAEYEMKADEKRTRQRDKARDKADAKKREEINKGSLASKLLNKRKGNTDAC